MAIMVSKSVADIFTPSVYDIRKHLNDKVKMIESDIDGVLDEGNAETNGDFSLTTTLSVGVHTLTATATDPAGVTVDTDQLLM